MSFASHHKVQVSCRLAVVAALVAVNLVAVLRGREGAGHGPRALILDKERALGHPDIAHLTPVLAPRVAHNPVEALRRVRAPADNGDDVIDALAHGLDDALLVVEERLGVDAARDGPALVDLLHHGISPADGAVVGDRGVGVVGEASAGATLLGEAAAGACDVHRLAGGVHIGAEALLRVVGAGKVGLGGLVADARAFLRDRVQPLVRAVDGSPVAGADTAAVQEVLDSEVNVDALALAGNLDAIAQGREGPMRPARATVLGDVLVPRHRAVAHAVLVAPVKVCRHV
mmetsp:Transcript_11730/g.26759  ORF Transcript_11730/g.26759 Transcript_11730/m.26759 type:complete len:287 (-) Transcript_11730:227-1087(-)